MSDSLISSPIGPLPSDWSCLQIKEIVDPARKVTYGIVQPGPFTENGVLLIRGQDYINGWVGKDDYFLVSPTLHNQFRRSRVQSGDVLMCIVGYTGEANIVPNWIKEANITQTTARLSCDTKKYDPAFLLHFLKSDAGKEQVSKYTKGSAQPGLNLADVDVFFVPTPPLPQQRKIARILTTVDNLIEKTEALIAKYQAIKQGMMHDLFTRGVDEHGHLRPPYEEAPELYKQSELGWIPKEWEVERYGDACDKVGVGIATSTTVHFRERGVPLLRNQNILTTGIQTDDLLYISPEFDIFNKTKRIRPNDILTMRTGYPGKSALVPPEMDGWQTFTTLISHPVETKYRSEFIVRQINGDASMAQIQSLQGGGAQQNLNVGWFVNLRVQRPPMSEQDAIIARLKVVENNIRQSQHIKAKYEQTKIGLMQDLLTGTVRVKVDEAEGFNCEVKG